MLKLAVLALAHLAICHPTAQDEEVSFEDPVAIDGHNRGSSMCRTINQDECNLAVGRFEDEQIYYAHTALSVVFDQWFFTGCKAEYSCKNEADYDSGVSGEGIKAAQVPLYHLNKLPF